jgi:hypothetical protein
LDFLVPRFLNTSFPDWHILQKREIDIIAMNAPTSVDELTSLGILGDKKVEEYGPRIVKPIRIYVEREGLEGYLAKGRAKRLKADNAVEKIAPSVVPYGNKRSGTKKQPASVIEIEDSDEEFEDDIDYSAINLDAIGKATK